MPSAVQLDDIQTEELTLEVCDGAESLQELERLLLPCPKKKITQVYIQSTNITSLPKKLFEGFTELRLLSIDGGYIRKLPEELLADSRKLETIELNCNGICDIPTILEDLYMLKVLRFTNNQIECLKPCMFECLFGLVELHLDANEILQLPNNCFKGLEYLELLSLNGNRIKAIKSDSFRGLYKLRKLFLADNSLQGIPDDCFSAVKCLEELGLKGNRLKTFEPRVFSNLAHLKVLDLQCNRFSELDFVQIDKFLKKSKAVDLLV